MTLAEGKIAVCDTAGFYDQFHVSSLMQWFPQSQQVIRDAVRELAKEGLLEKVSRGVYQWKEA